jgi:hypothetical protein
MAKDPFFISAVIARMEMSGRGSNYVHTLLNKIRVGSSIRPQEIKEAICRLWLKIEERDQVIEAATELIDFVIAKYDVRSPDEFTCPYHKRLNDLLGERTRIHREGVNILADKPKVEEVDYQAKFEALADAVKEFYQVGHWTCDRQTPKPEHIYFEQLRDAARIEPGHAPEPAHPEQVSLDV